jgi:hypothetical protein
MSLQRGINKRERNRIKTHLRSDDGKRCRN